MKIVDRLGSLENDGDAEAEAEIASVIAKASKPKKRAIEDAPSIDVEDTMPLDAPLSAQVAPRSAFSPDEGQRSPAQAASAAAIAALGDDAVPGQEDAGRVRSMLGGLSRVLGKKKQAPTPALAGSAVPDADDSAAPSVDLTHRSIENFQPPA